MMTNEKSLARVEALVDALASKKHSTGYTHNFYLYPARFSPTLARTVILNFSNRGDYVMDPFMGGGTSIVEGLLLGRRMIGVDLNALACFISSVRTTPLSRRDEATLLHWASIPFCDYRARVADAPASVANLPRSVRLFVASAMSTLDSLPFRRQQAFARCSLLRLGQLATDCREPASQSFSIMAERLPELVREMLDGLRQFVEECKANGYRKNNIVANRVLLNRSSVGIDGEENLRRIRPKLIVTSPPYPRVHVLYHRWQVAGRKETSAPYWIAQVSDGYFASYYTGGSRTPSGERNYFLMIREAYSSVRRLIARDGVVAQLVGFTDIQTQLPKYLDAMNDAGFEALDLQNDGVRLWRNVPNRKWYATMRGATDSACEVLLVHRPRHPAT